MKRQNEKVVFMMKEFANREKENKTIQELIDSDPDLAKEAEEFRQAYELWKKMVLARKEAGLHNQIL